MMEERKVPALRFQGFTDEWEKSEFKDVFHTLKNNTLSRAELHDTGTVQDLHYGDILTKFGEYLDMSEIKLPFITNSSNLQDFKSSFLQNGDIVMADTAEDETVGKCSELANINEKILLSGLHTIPLRPLLKFASGYLGDYLNSPAYHDQLLPLMQGTKVTSISRGNLMITKVKFPSRITEQDKIAKYFLMINKIINLCSEKCNQLMAFKKSMLENMFPRPGEKVPKVRFRGFTGDWEIHELNSYLEPSKEKNTFGNYTKDDVLSVSGDFGVVNQIQFQGRSFAGASVLNYGVVHTDDFIYTKSPLKANPYGIIKTNSGMAGIVSTLYAVYRPKNGVVSKFIECYFDDDYRLNKYLHPLVNKGAKNDMKISSEKALQGEVIFPPSIEEQLTIAQTISAIEKVIMLCQRKLEKLQSMKQAMLSEMFI